MEEIGYYIDRTYKAVRQDLTNRFKEADLDLTPEQWIILSRLENKSELSQTDLATASFKDKPTISRIIDKLSKKKLVIRHSDEYDRRKYIVKLTKKGQSLIQKARPLVLASRALGWKELSQEEYQVLRKTLDKIFNNYQDA